MTSSKCTCITSLPDLKLHTGFQFLLESDPNPTTWPQLATDSPSSCLPLSSAVLNTRSQTCLVFYCMSLSWHDCSCRILALSTFSCSFSKSLCSTSWLPGTVLNPGGRVTFRHTEVVISCSHQVLFAPIRGISAWIPFFWEASSHFSSLGFLCLLENSAHSTSHSSESRV